MKTMFEIFNYSNIPAYFIKYHPQCNINKVFYFVVCTLNQLNLHRTKVLLNSEPMFMAIHIMDRVDYQLTKIFYDFITECAPRIFIRK